MRSETPFAASDLERPLDDIEWFCWLADQISPWNCLIAAEVSGPLTRQALRAALDAVQARHPLLRVRIVPESRNQMVFRFTANASVPLRIVEKPNADWVFEAEQELATRFPIYDGPLLRCTLLGEGSPRTTVMMTFPHLIGDGLSAMVLLRDLMQAAGAACEGKAINLSPRRLTRPMTELYPRWARGLQGLCRYGQSVVGEAARTCRWGFPRRLPRDEPASSPLRNTRILPIGIDPEKTSALIRRAHQERTTLYAVLTAAQLKSIAAEFNSAVPLGIVTAVNVRRRLDPQIDEEDLGLYAATAHSVHRVESSMPTWNLARQIRSSLTQRARRNDPALFAFDRYLKAALVRRLVRVDKQRLEKFSRSDPQSPAASVLSLLPTLTNVREYGPLLVTSVQGALSQSHYAWVGLAGVFNGYLRGTFNYHQGPLSPDRAQRLAGRTLDVLKAAIE